MKTTQHIARFANSKAMHRSLQAAWEKKKWEASFNLLTHLLSLFLIFGFSSARDCIAQEVPHTMNYQGILRTQEGTPIGDESISLRVSILDALDMTILFSEIHESSTNQFGLFTLTIGSVNNTLADFNWSRGNYLLKIEADIAQEGSYGEISEVPFGSVPYALYAEMAGNVGGPIDLLISNEGDLAISQNENTTTTFPIANSLSIEMEDNTLALQQNNTAVSAVSLSVYRQAAEIINDSLLILSGTGTDSSVNLNAHIRSNTQAEISVNQLLELGQNSIDLSILKEGLTISPGSLLSIGPTGQESVSIPSSTQGLWQQTDGQDGIFFVDDVTIGNDPISPYGSLNIYGDAHFYNPSQTIANLAIGLERNHYSQLLSTQTSSDIFLGPALILESDLGDGRLFLSTVSARPPSTQSIGGSIILFSPNNLIPRVTLDLQSLPENNNHGKLRLADIGAERLNMAVALTENGRFFTNGPNNENTTLFDHAIVDNIGYPNRGAFQLNDPSGAKLISFVNMHDAGELTTFGPGLQPNASIGSDPLGTSGILTLTAGAATAGVQLENNQFSLFGATKPFRSSYPDHANKEIWYVAVEGPEATAYLRGTAILVDGIAHIHFPDHFSKVITEQRITARVTPLSASSKGLAVIEKNTAVIVVKELQGGQGNYSFDWEVTGVRSGYEDFEPVRRKDNSSK